jgi:hypothetical protein
MEPYGCDYDVEHWASQERFYVMAYQELTVYGHTVYGEALRRFPEDAESFTRILSNGREFGCWHSIACPKGESGSNPLNALKPITFEQFQQAAKDRWPYSDELTAGGPVTAISVLNPETGHFDEIWDSLGGHAS